MRFLQKVSTIACVGLLLSAVFMILPVATSAQVYCTHKTITIVDYQPRSAQPVGENVAFSIALTGHCDMSDGTQLGGPEDGAQVTWSFPTAGITRGPITTDSSGVATATDIYSSVAFTETYTVHIVDDQNNQHITLDQSFQVTFVGGSTPTPTPTQQPATPTPTLTPTPTATQKPATPTPQQATPVSSGQVQTAVQTAGGGTPSSVSWGTSPMGNPQATVTQKPRPDLLRTTIMTFAKNPEGITAEYNKQVTDALSGGWKLTAQGHRTYSNGNENYQYSRFSKGGNTLSMAAQGPNATGKMIDIPTDQSVLISQEDQVIGDTSGISLFGLSGVPAWLAIGGIAAAVAVIVIALWYDRQKKKPDDEQSGLSDYDETVPYEERERRL